MSDAAHPDEKDKALSRLAGELLTLQRALRELMQKHRDPNPSLINLLGDDPADWKDHEPPSPLERDREIIAAINAAFGELEAGTTPPGYGQLAARVTDILAGRTPEEGAKLRGEVVEPRDPGITESREFKDPEQIAAEAFGVAPPRAAGEPVVAEVHDEAAAMHGDEDVVSF